MDATRPMRAPVATCSRRDAEREALIADAGEALAHWLSDLRGRGAEFYRTAFCLACLQLGLTVQDARRIAVRAYRGQRAAEVTA